MSQKAYHTVILPDGNVHHLAVVAFAADGHFLSWHPLNGEEPFVEWVGGTLDLRIKKVVSY